MVTRDQIIKLTSKDKKKLGLKKINFIVKSNGNVKGFRTLSSLNRSLGLSKRIGFKTSSFKKK